MPPSLPASIKEFLKEGHSGKALGESHAPVRNIYKICYSSTKKRSGAIMEDVTPGIHAVAYTATRSGDGPGRLLQAGSNQTTCCARHHKASSRIGIEFSLS